MLAREPPTLAGCVRRDPKRRIGNLTEDLTRIALAMHLSWGRDWGNPLGPMPGTGINACAKERKSSTSTRAVSVRFERTSVQRKPRVAEIATTTCRELLVKMHCGWSQWSTALRQTSSLTKNLGCFRDQRKWVLSTLRIGCEVRSRLRIGCEMPSKLLMSGCGVMSKLRMSSLGRTHAVKDDIKRVVNTNGVSPNWA